MVINGLKVIISNPRKSFKSVIVKSKRKLGPSTVKVKRFTGFVELIEDDKIIIDKANRAIYVNQNQYDKLIKEQGRSHGY